MFSIKDKRQDIRFTKQISVCFAYILEKRDFDWRSGGGTMGAGGALAPRVIQGESKKPDTFDIQMNNKGVSFF